MLKMAFIGCGKSTTRYHIPYVKQRENIHIKSIYTPSWTEEKKEAAGLPETSYVTDLNNLLNDEEIELISICTPPTTHYELAKTCLEHGKNVLVEKPFCSTVEEAEEILQLAKEKGLVAMPYQNRRFDSDYLTLVHVLESKKIGEIFEVEIHFDRFRPVDERPIGTKVDGEFYGLGIHLLDKVLALFGTPEQVFYDIRTMRKLGNPDDAFEIQLLYPTKKVILKVNQLILGDYPSIRVHGRNGSFIKYEMDQQEACLKAGIMPGEPHFGEDQEEDYGILKYVKNNEVMMESVPTVTGNYGSVYDAMYQTIKHGADKLVSDEEIKMNIHILQNGIAEETPRLIRL
ncbi:oxidoreductase [Metabacillus rhizolycopersici]|uniref:Oxidoreductase n=1 Tax=Metabacillus rhizolycopersici TaxID=2875709 RepID=A0ABS7UZ02_9BACI|nr:oxidoreductase [Metabacillus rhizolycopersici]MBZ5753561.1 oxidoreductase [Metabacillus rhizolycopersici]